MKRMNLVQKIIGAVVLGFASMAYAGEAPKEPKIEQQESTFERLYGQEERKVRKGKEHYEFGRKLAEESKDSPLEEVLEEHAITHLKKADKENLIDAYTKIFEVHKDDIQDFPDENARYLNLLIKDADSLLRRLSYKDKENKASVNAFIADNYFTLGNVFEQEGKYKEAAKAFSDAERKYRFLKGKSQKRKESGVRARENVDFYKDEEKFKKMLSSGRLNKKGSLEAGVELLKRGEYEKAKEFLKDSDNAGYSDAIRLLTADLDEKVTPAGLRESQIEKFNDKVGNYKGRFLRKDDKDGLVDLILEFTVEPELEKRAVVAAGSVEYSKGDVDWDYLVSFSNEVSAFMKANGKEGKISLEDSLKTARLFEELSKPEKRTGVKKRLLEKSLGHYVMVDRNAKKGTMESLEAGSMIDRIKKELAQYGDVEVGGLELVATSSGSSSVKIPKGAVLYMSFDEGTVVNQAGRWIVKDLSGRGNHGVIRGKFAGLNVYNSPAQVPPTFDLALVRGPSGKKDDWAMYFAGKNGYVEVKDDLNSYPLEILIKFITFDSFSRRYLISSDNPRHHGTGIGIIGGKFEIDYHDGFKQLGLVKENKLNQIKLTYTKDTISLCEGKEILGTVSAHRGNIMDGRLDYWVGACNIDVRLPFKGVIETISIIK